MRDINTFVLIGRLTANPETKMTTIGKMVASFTLAVSGGKDGEGNEYTHYLPITTFGSVAENVSNYCFKGNRVAVRGFIRLNSYFTKEGIKISKVDLISEEVQFLEPKEKKNEEIIAKEENSTLDFDLEDLPF